MLAALGLGGILFLKQKQGYWSTPVFFMGGCFLCEAVFGGREAPLVFFSGVVFTAFFLLADSVTLPLTRKGTVLFVLGAAFLSSCLNPGGFSISSAGYAILGMNLLTPWLDVWLKPVPYRSKSKIKATCSI
jgi:electron transport complex protein RnfD